MLYFEKNCKIIFFRGLSSVSENAPKIISIGTLITEKLSFKKLKIWSILARFISKIKKSDILNFPSIKYFVKCFLFLKIWNARVNYCGNYRPSNLLFCFTGQSLEVSGRSFKIFDPVTEKWRPFEVIIKIERKGRFIGILC